MTVNGWLQVALYCVLLVLLTKPLGGYMTRVFAGRANPSVPGVAAPGTGPLSCFGRR